jgi:voltage-gated potassium channel
VTGLKSTPRWKSRLHEIIFEADTPAGKLFDVLLIISIIVSVIMVMLDSVAAINQLYGHHLYMAEWYFTLLFTVEYIMRLLCVGRPLSYATSFFGIVDLLAVIPTYLSLLVPGGQVLLVIRILRVLRIFRILKLAQYIGASQLLLQSLKASRDKIIVFLITVFILVIIFGSAMYMIESEANGFTSIPRSIYWAIVTLTTVGYGDISPQTSLGQMVAAIIMIIGYSIIAVPTGIVTATIVQQHKKISTQACPQCGGDGHDHDAEFCKYCGSKL